MSLADDSTIETGSTIFAMGNPSGLTGTISPGIISAIRDVEGQELLQISAPVSHGSSGGPILNSNGEVVGVAVSTLKEGQNLNFAVPVTYLMILMDKAGLSYTQERESTESEAANESGMDESADQQQEWVFIGNLQDRSIYFNQRFFSTTSQGNRQVWLKNIPYPQGSKSYRDSQIKVWKKQGKPTKGYDRYSHTVLLMEVDCKALRMILVNVIDFDINNQTLNSMEFRSREDWITIPPDSKGSNILKTACLNRRN